MKMTVPAKSRVDARKRAAPLNAPALEFSSNDGRRRHLLKPDFGVPMDIAADGNKIVLEPADFLKDGHIAVPYSFVVVNGDGRPEAGESFGAFI